MKFTLSWLKDHLDTTASLEQIGKTLTMVGLEVESITDRAEALKAFTVAKILQAEKHPEADKLRVCNVQSDVGELQIVCGAPNARAGIFVALAKEGAHIPGNGMVIKKTKIRGVESNGMLCSREELGLEGDSSGIIELPEAPVGSPVANALGLADPVIEIAITPNRADCLGVRGVARDLAAAGLGTLKPLPSASYKPQGASPVCVSITTADCKQFIGVYIKGVKNGPAPDWLKNRLGAIGQKSISALVDITNYFTFDLGRPLHVYDAKKLKGNLTVRGAQGGEPVNALDGKHYELTEGMCVIADASGTVALGGIIGGEPTGCDETTTDVFLEVAYFDPVQVAKTGRALDILSDARYRFERGVDPAFLEEGARLALSLIQELCGGEASELVIAGKAPEWKRSIAFNPERVKTLGGVDVPAETCYAILEKLGFSVVRNPSSVTPPSWRADVEGEADLVEEILRIHGYDHIPSAALPKLPVISKPSLTLLQKRAQLSRRLLASRGFMECCTYSFTSEKYAGLFGGNNPSLKLLNPISTDLAVMRPSLLCNLLEAAKKNANRGFKDVRLSEIGLQFSDATPQGQRLVAGAVATGHNRYFIHENGLKECVVPLEAFDAKTHALALLGALGAAKHDVTVQVPSWYHPGRAGALTLGGKIIMGYFGEIHPGLLAHYDLSGPVVAFEIFLDAIPAPRAKGKTRPALKLSDFQAVERDFAFIVDAKVSVAEMEKSIRAAEKTLITGVSVFDVYAGKGVEPGKKSVALKVTLQSFERTLAEADIMAVSNAILAAAAKFGGMLRQ